MKIILKLSFLFCLSVQAEQTVINNYADARDNYFWSKLYIDNKGESLYCGLNRPFPQAEKESIEHVYAADWMAKHYGCSDRNCDHPDYKRAEGDLHNLWPEIQRINSSRGKSLYNEIEPDHKRFPHLCDDYERSSKSGDIPAYVEPRELVKGNIARSIFYMYIEYGLPVPGDMKAMLKRWNRLDPPGEHEHWRNDFIFELQGTRNTFIDNYFLGNAL